MGVVIFTGHHPIVLFGAQIATKRGIVDLNANTVGFYIYPRAELVALIIQASLDLNPDVIAISHTQ